MDTGTSLGLDPRTRCPTGQKRRQITREFQVEAVRLVTDDGRRTSEVVRESGIRADLLRIWKWKQQADSRTALGAGTFSRGMVDWPAKTSRSGGRYKPVRTSRRGTFRSPSPYPFPSARLARKRRTRLMLPQSDEEHQRRVPLRLRSMKSQPQGSRSH